METYASFVSASYASKYVGHGSAWKWMWIYGYGLREEDGHHEQTQCEISCLYIEMIRSNVGMQRTSGSRLWKVLIVLRPAACRCALRKVNEAEPRAPRARTTFRGSRSS